MKRNSSKPKRRYGDAGFTLVELVVVIAVLAILAGVGAVAYNGYIDYANKGVDRQTVGEVMHALELADYADSNLFGEGALLSVYLTNSGVQAIPKVQAALSDAMDLSSTRLKYDKWQKGADIGPQMAQLAGLADTIGLKSLWESGAVDANGNIPVARYAASADEMWEEVLKTAAEQAGKGEKTPGEYLQLAAQYTTTTGTNSGAAMGTAWQTNGLTTSFADAGSSKEQAAALLAACMARNNAFAEFVTESGSKYNISQETLDFLHSTDNKMDLLSGYIATESRPGGQPDVNPFEYEDWAELHKAANDYLNNAVYTVGGTTYTQAYVDGMVYYGLMQSVVNMSGTEDGKYDPKSDDYLDKIGSIVSLTGSVLSGTTSLDDINAELTLFDTMKDTKGSVVRVSATKSGGVLSFDVWPKDANPRDGSTHSNAPTAPTEKSLKATIDLSTGVLSTEPDNGVIAVNSKGRITLGNTSNVITLPDGVTVTSISCNGKTAQKGSNQDAELSNGTLKMVIGNNDAAKPVLTLIAGDKTGTSSDVSITFGLSDGTSKTVSFTFWVID